MNLLPRFVTALTLLAAAPSPAWAMRTGGAPARPGPASRVNAAVMGGNPTVTYIPFAQPQPLVQGELSRDMVRRVIWVHLNEIRHCYQQELLMRPGLNGRLVVNFWIDPQGQVHDLQVGKSTFNLPSLDLCVAESMRRWEFPAQTSESVTQVNYPFVLRPKERDLSAVGISVSDDELAAVGLPRPLAPPEVDIVF